MFFIIVSLVKFTTKLFARATVMMSCVFLIDDIPGVF